MNTNFLRSNDNNQPSSSNSQPYLPLDSKDINQDLDDDSLADEPPFSLTVESEIPSSANEYRLSDVGRNSERKKTRRSRQERYNNVTQPYEFDWSRTGPLDLYLDRVYRYFEGKGIYCIILKSFLDLLYLICVGFFTVTVGGCLDYSKFQPHLTLKDAFIQDCVRNFSLPAQIILVLFSFMVFWQIVKIIYDARDLIEIYHFYTKVLGIPDEDMQTVEWNEVVKKMALLPPPQSSSGAQHLDVYQVAHRVMRIDNYMIALFNTRKLDLTSKLPNFLGGGQYSFGLTRSLEWSIMVCLADTFFDKRGRLKKGVLRREERAIWAGRLRNKLHFMGFINIILGPFVVSYTFFYLLFRYFEEYRKTPKAIGLRQYTNLAKWRLREFNELPHYLRNRLEVSTSTAEEYLDHFPRYKTDMVFRFISFVAGTLAGAIAIVALIDSELVLHFEVLKGWTLLSCGAVLGVILTSTRAPPTKSSDTQGLLENLLEQLHYMPKQWQDRLHSERVRQEFSKMFTLKAMQLGEEFLGLLLTPYLLLFVIPRSCYPIVDLFREDSQRIPGVGHVCSLAMFETKQHQGELRLNTAQDGKLEKSLVTFKTQNPEWSPDDPASSIYLAKLQQSNGMATGEHALSQSQMTHSSYLEEPVTTNPFNRAIPMKVLSMMLEQPQTL